MSVYSNDTVECKRCSKKLYTSFDVQEMFYVEECWHLFCLSCIRKYIDEEFIKSGGELKCPSSKCEKTVNQYQLKVEQGLIRVFWGRRSMSKWRKKRSSA